MKTTIRNLLAAILLIAASIQIHAQGLVYDQESTNPPSIIGDYLNIQEDSPLTQSFVPELSAIGFVQLEFWDVPNNGNNGATVFVNLWEGSPNINSATLLGSTTSIFMPNGFGTDSAGVTTFNFSSFITLIPGNTYYFQPVVLSGDNPWDIYAPGDTYPNGELFESGYALNADDLWFREGIESVPEPSLFALIGLGVFLFFAFKWRSKLAILSLLATSALSVYAAPDSVVQTTADAAGLAPVSAAALPSTGTFWIATIDTNNGLIMLPPYPTLPTNLTELPIFLITNNIFLVDSTAGQISTSSATMSRVEAASAVSAQSQTVESLIEMVENPPPPPGTNEVTGGTNSSFQIKDLAIPIDANGLWLEATNEGSNLGFILHNPTGLNYQLLSASNLLDTNWNLGQILYEVSGDYVDFSSVPPTNAMMFYRVHQAAPVIRIYNNQNAIELDPTNISNPGQSGNLYLVNEGWATNDVTIYYAISGTAQNGIDYSNLTGSMVMPLDSTFAEIDINPLETGINSNKTVILTLLQNTNYLVDPVNDSATNIIQANPLVYPIVNGDNQRVCPNTINAFNLQATDPRGLPLTYTITAWPIHGTLNTNEIPYITYTPTNCYEGLDSFTFQANDGQYASAATVTLSISDPVYANPVHGQACHGMSVNVTLHGSDSCGETMSYAVISEPAHGFISGTLPNLIYTSTDTNFTGIDTFDYAVYSECGNLATNTVAITVGDDEVDPVGQNIMTGTNEAVAITLNAFANNESCLETNYFTYTLTNSPAHGTLTGSGADLTYTPNPGFKGFDSFRFVPSDGIWTTNPSAPINIYVVDGPILNITCDPVGTAIQLNWSLDTNVVAMWQQGMTIDDFVVYRSTNFAGPFTAIATNTFINETNGTYLDTNAVAGPTYFYAVNFETPNSVYGGSFESPFSNISGISDTAPNNLMPANTFWQVVINTNNPTNVVTLQAPFSSWYPSSYPGVYPPPNSSWTTGTTMSNSTTLFIPTNTDLYQVQYAIAIDNGYDLYVNNTLVSSNYFYDKIPAWNFQSFPNGTLHYGTNTVGVLIIDDGIMNYFSMVVTTNTCDQ